MLFNLFNPEGLLAESLASDGTVSGRSELADILKGNAYRSGIAQAPSRTWFLVRKNARAF